LVIIFLANVLKEKTHGYSRRVYQKLGLPFDSASSPVDRGVEPRLGQSKDYTLVLVAWRKTKDGLTRNVSEWSDMSTNGLLLQ
jgi:hypothetical protein